MAQIAFARTFDGVDDKLYVDGGVDPTFGTIVLLMKRITGDSGEFRCFYANKEGSGSQGVVYTNTANDLRLYHVSETDAGINVTVAEGWVILAVTKATGSVAPRHHKYVYGTTTWSHANASPAIGNWTDQATAQVFGSGHASGGEYGAMVLACAAVWESVLSDGNLETLTDSVTDWDALSPASRWLFNQPSVTDGVSDAIGSNEETSRVGTTATSISDLPFDDGSTVLQTALADADIVTTGWSTAPLFSKINDASDATVITATAS